MAFFPELELSQLVGLAIFGFFTGLGSSFGIEFSKYLIEKMKKNAERSFNIVKNHTRKREDSS